MCWFDIGSKGGGESKYCCEWKGMHGGDVGCWIVDGVGGWSIVGRWVLRGGEDFIRGHVLDVNEDEEGAYIGPVDKKSD